jgi:hypothetical protein
MDKEKPPPGSRGRYQQLCRDRTTSCRSSSAPTQDVVFIRSAGDVVPAIARILRSRLAVAILADDPVAIEHARCRLDAVLNSEVSR